MNDEVIRSQGRRHFTHIVVGGMSHDILSFVYTYVFHVVTDRYNLSKTFTSLIHTSSIIYTIIPVYN